MRSFLPMTGRLWLSLGLGLSSGIALLSACTVENKDDYTFIPDDAFKTYVDSGVLPGDEDAAPPVGECEVGEFMCTDSLLIGCTDELSWQTEDEATDCGSAALCDAFRGVCRECTPGEYRCTEEKLEQCDLDGSGFELVATCDDADACKVSSKADSGYCVACEPGEAVCDPRVLAVAGASGPGSEMPSSELRTCNDDGNGTVLEETCGFDSPFCSASEEACLACEPHSVECVNGRVVTCNADGTNTSVTEDCGTVALCQNGECLSGECDPTDGLECDGAADIVSCGLDGTLYTLADCLSESRCDLNYGHCSKCAPGSRCVGQDLHVCPTPGVSGRGYPAYGEEYTRLTCNTCTVVGNGGDYCAAVPYGDTCPADALVHYYASPGDIWYYTCDTNTWPGQPYYLSSTYGTQCPAGEVNFGVPASGPPECGVCQPDVTRCQGTTLYTCNSSGTAEESEDCADNDEVCDPKLGRCLPARPGSYYCTNAGVLQRMGEDGEPIAEFTEDCGGRDLCDPERGCLKASCAEGAALCDGTSVVECTNGLETDNTGTECDFAARCQPGLGCTHAIALAAGDSHTCAIMAGSKADDGDAGYLVCWGANESGQLGNGSSLLTDSLEPRNVIWYSGGRTSRTPLAAPNATSVCAGKDFTCATLDTSDGPRVACWGSNAVGQLGIDSDEEDPQNYAGAFVTTGDDDVAGVQVACGSNFACALDADGLTYCWGANDAGQLGSGAAGEPVLHAQVIEGLAFVQIAAGARHACGVDAEGKVLCWGAGLGGQLGNGDTADVAEPTEIDSLVANVDMAPALGRDFTLVNAAEEASPYAFGANDYGQLATGDFTDAVSPVAASALDSAELSNLFAGANSAHACATTGNVLWCWGANMFGQLGNETTEPSFDPVQVLNGATNATRVRPGAHSVAVGRAHACAITNQGDVLCWGANFRKQLGSDNATPVTLPTQAL